MRSLEDRLLYAADRCQMLKSMYKFNDHPLSEEESEFSLAYGMLVYKELPQVLFMLSSIYHPQNEYCLAVGENSDVLFQNLLKELANCFPNVHFMKRPPIKWGSHEIINSAYECLEFLSQSKSKWKYFQYLSGVDVPLKTNLEMVQILKELNGTANVEIKNYQWQRLKGKNYTSAPLPLFKSSLSAVIPREAANELASSLMPRNILEFLENTGIADEGFWGTLFGNKKLFNIPGSLDFKEYIDYRDTQNLTWPTDGWKYYISRDQTWTKTQCHNYMTSGSCVYGIGDVPRLLKSTALVAHKFYLKSEPEAYFCILKEIRRRSLSPDPDFSAKKYSELPTVELARGLKYSELTHKNWML
ncbi:hypothetical protein CAEBREN_31736 [Caenorhabditis brenneri]|uniref:Uncharacterized protein n=1 Tax=Caenorhabditis brenneri TaxID=135651 RepID=G0NWN5_CAEBE|nr:hypothetical protein CAEBREN_31736 [Caenorhabditis brenneri]